LFPTQIWLNNEIQRASAMLYVLPVLSRDILWGWTSTVFTKFGINPIVLALVITIRRLFTMVLYFAILDHTRGQLGGPKLPLRFHVNQLLCCVLWFCEFEYLVFCIDLTNDLNQLLSKFSCFSATCQLAMVNCLALVVNVLVTMTTAKELLTSVGELEAVKDNNGVAQCVTSPPNKTVTARSKIDCMRVCISEGCSCAYGANYHSDDKRCELHGEPPGSLEQVPSCVYYQVLTWSVYSANSTQPERCRKGSIPGQHKNHYRTILHHRPIKRTLKDQACSRFAGRTTFNKKMR